MMGCRPSEVILLPFGSSLMLLLAARSRDRHARSLLSIALVVGASLAAVDRASAQERTATFDDFDSVALGDRWVMIGGENATAARVPVPAEVKEPGVADRMARIEFVPGAIFAMRNEVAWPELDAPSSIRLRLRAAEASEQDPERIEVRVYSRQRRAWRWRRIDLTDDRWRTVELPMPLFLHSDATHVRWNEAARLAIFSRTAGTIEFDRIELVAAGATGTDELTAEALSELAFGPRGRVVRREPFAIVTDCDDLQVEPILDRLDALRLETDSLLGAPTEPDPTVPLLIFREAAEFRTFFERLGQALQVTVAPPRTEGYTAFGIACCVRSDEFGPVRPIYVHETCHALLERRLGLSNRNEWLHEGLASHFQSRLLAQDEDRRRAATAVVADPAAWSELLSGKPIALDDYAEAMFLVEWLTADEGRRAKFVEALEAMRRDGSTTFVDGPATITGRSTEAARTEWLDWISRQR